MTFSDGSIKPRRLGFRHKVTIGLQGWADGPKHKKGPLPLGTLEPGIARIQQWVEKGNHRLAAICSEHRHFIPAAANQLEIQLAGLQRDLDLHQDNLDYVTARYKEGHDGIEPPERGAAFTQLASFWLLGGIFVAGELPLMSAALERLPVPDWQRFIAAAGASAITIYLAHHIGLWFKKPCKTLKQTIVGWLLVAVLMGILTFAASARRDSIRDNQKSPSTAAPQVYLNTPKGGHPSYV